MKYLPISELIIPEDRQRGAIAPKHLQELASSIFSKGLLHPPVVRNDGRTLVVGECRSRAIMQLHEDGLAFFCNGEPVPKDTIPVLAIADLTIADLKEAELEENLIRANLSWLEESEARVLIVELRKSQDENATLSSVARELMEKTGKGENATIQNLHRSIEVVKELRTGSPLAKKIGAAKSVSEAYRIVQDARTADLRREMVDRGIVKTEHRVLLGDCQELLKTLQAGTVDTILSDPPYGIKADEMKKTAGHHYDDSPQNALAIYQTIFLEGFRLLRPKGIIFLFCDFEHFLTIREMGQRAGFTAWRTPVIWAKGEDGQAPWGKGGFTRTYEIFALFTKGAKELKGGGPDVKRFARPLRGERVHAAEKPVDLLLHLLNLAADPGDVVLDPCCGSGPVLEAATRARQRAIAIELDPDYHAEAVSRLTTPTADDQGVDPTDSPLMNEADVLA